MRQGTTVTLALALVDAKKGSMASRLPASASTIESYSFSSVVTGHHKENWTPYISEELPTDLEPDNLHHSHAVAVLKNGEIVGHVPRTVASIGMVLYQKRRLHQNSGDWK